MTSPITPRLLPMLVSLALLLGGILQPVAALAAPLQPPPAQVKTPASTSLQQAYQPFFHIGTAVSLAQLQQPKSGELDLIAQHFNSLTAENLMKWERIQPTEGNFDFEAADKLVAFAEQHQMFMVRQQTAATGPLNQTYPDRRRPLPGPDQWLGCSERSAE